MIGSFFNRIQFDDIRIITSFQHFDLIFQQFIEFAYIHIFVPLMVSLFIVFIATCYFVS